MGCDIEPRLPQGQFGVVKIKNVRMILIDEIPATKEYDPALFKMLSVRIKSPAAPGTTAK